MRLADDSDRLLIRIRELRLCRFLVRLVTGFSLPEGSDMLLMQRWSLALSMVPSSLEPKEEYVARLALKFHHSTEQILAQTDTSAHAGFDAPFVRRTALSVVFLRGGARVTRRIPTFFSTLGREKVHFGWGPQLLRRGPPSGI